MHNESAHEMSDAQISCTKVDLRGPGISQSHEIYERIIVENIELQSSKCRILPSLALNKVPSA